MSSFKITADLLNGFCKKGLTVEEMAENISSQSGIKCSVGQVRKACKHYNISLKAKPRKSAFELDEIVDTVASTTASANQVVEETVENTVGELDLI